MRRLVLAPFLGLLLVLAGCNGVVFGGDETPAATVTPAAVPTDEPTSTPVPQLAPGLDATGVTDPLALHEAHASVLDDTSHTVRRESRAQYPNGTIYRQVTARRQYAANNSRFQMARTVSGVALRGGPTSTTTWSNGERVLVARTTDDSTSYTVPRSPDRDPIPPREFLPSNTGDGAIAALFSSVETRVAGRERRNGTTLYRIAATGTNPDLFETAWPWENPHDVTLRALISPRGLVREYRLNYTATLDGDPVRVRRHVRYAGIGNTTVERPPWYDEATENASTTLPTTER